MIRGSIAGHYEASRTTEVLVYGDVCCNGAKICQLDSSHLKDRVDGKKKFRR